MKHIYSPHLFSASLSLSFYLIFPSSSFPIPSTLSLSLPSISIIFPFPLQAVPAFLLLSLIPCIYYTFLIFPPFLSNGCALTLFFLVICSRSLCYITVMFPASSSKCIFFFLSLGLSHQLRPSTVLTCNKKNSL